MADDPVAQLTDDEQQKEKDRVFEEWLSKTFAEAEELLGPKVGTLFVVGTFQYPWCCD